MKRLYSDFFKCAIVDDDQLSIDVLKKFISQIPEFRTVFTYTNPAQAINDISINDKIDFLFLDIQMDISGLDVAKVLRDKVRYLIFVTGHEEYAIDAFSVNCDKFLVKPVSYEKLLTAVEEIFAKERRQAGLV
ncbi:LytR/AlgR family response regulator transcription factor [Pedobacter frigidisoli]|nr:response regulator [Pedobacter frigidisoli]